MIGSPAILSAIRPNRLTAEKDEKYHLDYARYIVSSSYSNQARQRFVKATLINWAFYKGKQWIFDEDLDGFFMDEEGAFTNRIKVVKNLIQPLVKQYEGTACRMGYRSKVRSIDDRIIVRKEQELLKRMSFAKAAKAIPSLRSTIMDRVPIGSNDHETKEEFERTFTDSYEEAINRMHEFINKKIRMPRIYKNLAIDLAVSGMSIYKGFDQNGHYMGKRTDPLFFLPDLSCVEDDFSDSEYMGEWGFMDTPSILERFQNISPTERTAIEKSVVAKGNFQGNIFNYMYGQANMGRSPVFEVYWKDIQTKVYAWQEDGFGDIVFDEWNEESGNKLIEKSRIPERYKENGDGEVMQTIYLDDIRFASFIPAEELGFSSDILLDYGKLRYQEKDKLDPSTVSWPYKIATWLYDKGDIIAPIETAINPQRVINRMLSVQEGRFNRMTGSGPVIARETLINTDEQTVRSAVAKGDAIIVDALKFGGVNNAVGTYGGNYAAQTNKIFETIREFELTIDSTTGVNAAMKGQSGGPDVLAGVVQRQINQGSVIQEPFYFALDHMMQQIASHQCNVGKQIYADNPSRLVDIVGDSGAKVIEITKEIASESYRCFTERVADKPSAIEYANNLLLTLFQYQLIDQETVSAMYGRSDGDEVADAFRDYQKKAAIARREAAQQQQQQLASEKQQQTAQVQYAMQMNEHEIERDQVNKDADRKQKEENSIRTNETKKILHGT